MKPYRTFKEYLSSKGKVVTNPPVDPTPDYKGPKEKSPKKGSTKGKNWEVPNVGKKGNPAPYKGGNDKAPKKPEKGGFADMGDKALVYEPGDTAQGGKGKVSKSTEGVPGGKGIASWPKGGPNTTESFIAATKGMTTAQFAKHVKKSLTEHCGCENKKAPHVVAYSAGAFHPDPIQAIRYVTYLANENANLRNALVREANRCGCTEALIQDLLTIPEAFKALAKIVDSDKGEAFQRRLELAIRENREEHKKKAKINEEVDEPAHDDEMDMQDVNPSKEKHKVHDEDDDDDDDDLDLDDDDDLDDGDGDGDGDDDGDLGGDDLDKGDVGGDDDAPPPPPDKGMGDKGDMSGMDDDLGGDDLDKGDMGGDDDSPPPPPDKGMGGKGDDLSKDGDDQKIDFDDDDDEDDDDLDLDDDEDDDMDDDGDEDDEDDDHPHGKHEKMPWEEDDDM